MARAILTASSPCHPHRHPRRLCTPPLFLSLCLSLFPRPPPTPSQSLSLSLTPFLACPPGPTAAAVAASPPPLPWESPPVFLSHACRAATKRPGRAGVNRSRSSTGRTADVLALSSSSFLSSSPACLILGIFAESPPHGPPVGQFFFPPSPHELLVAALHVHHAGLTEIRKRGNRVNGRDVISVLSRQLSRHEPRVDECVSAFLSKLNGPAFRPLRF